MNWLHDTNFHYAGRDRRGVHKWTGGGWKHTLRIIGIAFSIYAILALITLTGMLVYFLVTSHWNKSFNVLTLVAAIHAPIFGGLGFWMIWLQNRVKALTPAEQVGDRLGLDAEQLTNLALEYGIKPKMVIDDKDYYDLADFNHPGIILLRGSQAPGSQQKETLLRASLPGSSEEPEQLLRATQNDYSTE